MPNVSPGPSPALPVSWAVALAASSALLIGGGAIIWAYHDQGGPDPGAALADPDRAVPPYLDMVDAEVLVKHLPGPAAMKPMGAGVHSISYAIENGVQVIKIQVVPNGDELIVEAATGRLLESRPSRPTSPPPVGKVAAPFVPAT